MCVLFTGIIFKLPLVEAIVRVDLRTVTFDVPPQEVCYDM